MGTDARYPRSRGPSSSTVEASCPLCIALRATEAGGFIAHHLPAIKQAVAGTDKQLTFDMGQKNGECHIILPPHYCAIRAQALVDRLEALTDDQGRPVLEADLRPHVAGLQTRRGGARGVRLHLGLEKT